MASLVAPCRSQLPHPRGLLLLLTFTIFAGSAAAARGGDHLQAGRGISVVQEDVAAQEVQHSAESLLVKSLTDAKAVLTGPQFAVAAVVDAAAASAAAAKAGGDDALARLKGYLYPLFVNDKPGTPCECRCPGGQCASADEADAVKKMEHANNAMLVMANLFKTFSDETC